MRLTRDGLRASLSAFRIRRNNVAVPDPADPGFQIQEGQYRVRGIELEGEWSPLPGWSLQGGYAYLDGRVTRSTTAALIGARLGETPEHSATAFTHIQLGSADLRASASYTGSRKVVNGGGLTLPGYLLVDLGFGTSLGPLRVDAALTNLFDETYYFSANGSVYSVGTEDIVFPGDPRTLSVRLSYAFGGTTGARRRR
jgi:iron complex outermembrane receptor protein